MSGNSVDAIGYKTEFGLACFQLLKDMRATSGPFSLFMRLYDSQFAIAGTANKCYPSLGVQLDNPSTWLMHCCFPLQVAKDGGVIRFKFPNRSGSIRTIGTASVENDTLKDFRPDGKTLEMLFDCLESWQRWDAIQNEANADSANLIMDVLREISPDSITSTILQAMLGAEINCPEKRKGQKVILKLAIFSEVTNDYRRYFKELKRLGCVLTGKNGRGFYLTETGIEVAEKLSAN